MKSSEFADLCAKVRGFADELVGMPTKQTWHRNVAANLRLLVDHAERETIRADYAENQRDVLHEVIGEIRGVCASAYDTTAERMTDCVAATRRNLYERDCLAAGIVDAAQKAGGYNGDSELNGPQLLMLVDDMAEAIVASRATKVSPRLPAVVTS